IFFLPVSSSLHSLESELEILTRRFLVLFLPKAVCLKNRQTIALSWFWALLSGHPLSTAHLPI
ncbi:MAG: hypothetical protein QNJ72_26130, partial [Pleurocapsa sp. MO_226.B13]|nr:hypothetical protein [Pleurocapsa sp. MO_226.B13]